MVVLICAAMIGGCAASDEQPKVATQIPSQPRVFPEVGSGEKLLYNPFVQRIVAYDVARKSSRPPTNVPNWFQYEFPTMEDVYTSGSSVDNDFSILRMTASGTKIMLRMPINQGVFPLARSAEHTYFTVSTYDSSGKETARRIAELISGRLVEIPASSGLVSSGAVVGSRLYFTVLDANSNSYILRSVPVDDRKAPFRTERTGLKAPALLTDGTRLFTSVNGAMTDGRRSLPCTDVCYIVGDRFLRIYVGTNQSISVDVMNLGTGAREATVGEVVGFEREHGELRIYSEGAVRVLKLKGVR